MPFLKKLFSLKSVRLYNIRFNKSMVKTQYLKSKKHPNWQVLKSTILELADENLAHHELKSHLHI